MNKSGNDLAIGRAALIAGIGYILMMATPFAEFYAFPKLVVPGDAAGTVKSLTENEPLFRYAIAGYLVNFVGDILAAWGLYIVLRPTHRSLSLLAFSLRLIYTLVSLSALLNLITVLGLIHHLQEFDTAYVNNQIMILIRAFRDGWNFSYFFFGSYLILLGYLVVKSWYIPTWIGIFIMLAGIGWMANNLQPLLYPNFEINFLLVAVAGLGELVLMFWLLIRGWRLKDHDFDIAS